LDGDGWSIREALGDTWEWYVGAPLPDAGNNVAEASGAIARAPGWLPARAPGAIIDDLHRAGELPDPRYARNSRAAEWVADRSWVYRRVVILPLIAPTDTVVLEFDGVDPGADVFWDGELIGSVNGLYRSARFAIPAESATAGRHRLALVVHPAPQSEPQVGRTDRVAVHAPRMGYGWDFSPRLRHQGVWKSTRLRIGSVLVADATLRPRVDEPLGRGIIDAEFSLLGESVSAGEPLMATLTVDLGDSIVGRASLAIEPGMDRARLRLTVAVDAPQLWWPIGVGDQPLYRATLSVEVGETGSGALDSLTRTCAFRTAAMVHNPGAPDDALPYTARVNGVVVPLVGWNWVPADTLYGSIDEAKVEHLLDLAARSGARLLRVWGGGLIESEHFYDCCDRIGLLVWQEFSQSSSGMQSAPSTDPAFVALMRSEADAIVPTRTHHPSFFVWGGGNELDDGGIPLDDERSAVLAALHAAVAEHDPGRAWLPTSPTGPEFHNRLDRISAAPDGQHDVHGPWEHQGLEGQYTLSNRGTSLAHTEFGVEGMTNLRSLDALVPEQDQWPADRSNPVYRHLGEWWNNASQVIELFGGRIETLADLNRASQLLQSTGLQYAVEADRRRAPRCSMVVPWQLGESYPNAWCTSSVDFYGEPKPAYFGVARAFGRQRATLRVARAAWGGHDHFAVDAWLWAEDGVGTGSTLTVRCRLFDGTVVSEVHFGPLGAIGDPAEAGRLDVGRAKLDAHTVFLWEAEWRASDGGLIDMERTLATTTNDFSPLLDLPRATVEMSVDSAAGDTAGTIAVWIRNIGEVGIPTLRIVDARPAGSAGWLLADGDPRPLLPGESRLIRLLWRGTNDPGMARLVGWNLPAIGIDVASLGAIS
jgi:beta-mannosidase